MKIIDISQSLPEEAIIRQQIEEIRRAYEKQLEPYYKKLAAVHNLRVPRYIILPDEQNKDQPK